MIKSKITVFCLLILLAATTASLAAPDSSAASLALQRIEIRISSRVPFKPGINQKKYLNRPVGPALADAIRDEIVDQFHAHGFYLARLDSSSQRKMKSGERAELILHFSPGPEFILRRVVFGIPDSLKTGFENSLDEIAADYTGKPYTADLQNNLFHAVLGVFEESGYPLCKLETEDFKLDSLSADRQAFQLNLKIEPGELVRLNGLKLPAKSDVDPRYLERTFRFRAGEVYQEKRIQRYQRLLNKQDFIKNGLPPQVVKGADNKYYLFLGFDEATYTSLDGVVGYVPAPTNIPGSKGYFTGLVNVGLRNLFGTGRRLNVFWQKPDRFSEEFRVKYREPFLLGLPFHTGVEMHRLIRDTTYIEWEYALNFELPLNEYLSGTVRFYNRQVYPDSIASAVLRLPRTRAVHTELGLIWDTRSDIYNPRRGMLISTSFDYGTQHNIGPEYLLKEDSLLEKTNVTRVNGELAMFFEFWKKQVLAVDFHTVLIGYQGQPVRLPDMFWFGGATTIRGYREQQFYGESVAWANNEYRFLLGPRSRFFVFTDLGYYSRAVPLEKKEFLMGYGLGIRFPGPIGVLQVDYGLARGVPFREGKIHFRLINEL